MTKVLIIETQLKQYRRRLLTELATKLRDHDIELKVAYSEPNRRERLRADSIELDGIGVKIPSLWLFDDRLVIQSIWRHVREAGLVIIEQGNKQVSNYALLALSRMKLKRVAYWGHGYNHQATTPGASEWLKRRLLTSVDWWFAYTDGVARYLVDHGVDAETVTTVHNTIDTRELAEAVARLSHEARAATRRRLDIAPGARVGLFCGSLYPEKRLDFLIRAAELVREDVPDFELVIVGDGPERVLVEARARERPYVHYVGAAFGEARAEYFAISDVFMIPSLVGLAVVDAFAAGLPVFTTRQADHGPELEYVIDGHNGEVVTPEVRWYAAAVRDVLRDELTLRRMQLAARATADQLSLGRMVDAFAGGVLRCLGAK